MTWFNLLQLTALFVVAFVFFHSLRTELRDFREGRWLR